MHREIERKFLIEDPSSLLKWAWEYDGGNYVNWDIWQAYINDNVRVRVQVLKRTREREVHYYLTIKSRREGVKRKEFEIELEEKYGKELLKEFKDNSVRKSRYFVQYKGKDWEVDVFQGVNDGLFLAEIELESEDEQFELPPGVGKEVTEDEKYYNSNLVKNPYKNWSKNG